MTDRRLAVPGKFGQEGAIKEGGKRKEKGGK
jgi:hypothetical protein